jgi:hypothetical protein
MDMERLATAHRTEGGVRSAAPATASFLPVMIGFNKELRFLAARTWTVRDVAPCLTWRNMHHLHLIRAFGAM